MRRSVSLSTFTSSALSHLRAIGVFHRYGPFLSRARARRLVETTAQRLTSTGQDGSMAGGWWCGSDPALRS
jgi:hypothetical protein